MNIEPLRARDFAQFAMGKGVNVPANTIPIGYSAWINGQIVGIGCLVSDQEGRAWAVVEVEPELMGRGMILHRLAKRFLTRVARIGMTVYALRNDDLNTSERWLTRLGFRKTDEVMNEREVWVK